MSVLWNGKLVGWLDLVNIDNFRFYGHWKSANSDTAKEFMSKLDKEEQLWVRVGNMDTWCTVEFPPDPFIEFTFRIGLSPDTDNQ